MRLNHSFRYLFPAGIIDTFAVICLAMLPLPGAAQVSRDCAPGVELRLSSPKSSQGSLLLVEVRSSAPLAELKGAWAGQALPFWRDDGPDDSRNGSHEDVRRALIGVDLQRPAGKYDLQLSAQAESGERVRCGAVVAVKAGRFANERLRVAPKFVEPSPEELKRAEQERQRLRETFARVTPERLWQGHFRLPLDGARTAGNFGRRRILNGQPGSPHSGADFPAAAGTPVHAAQRGRVMLAEELFFSGNTVLVDHGLGIYTFYGHLESIGVAAGDVVEAGVVLGRVGATGRATGPHLHWGLTVNGARVNPLQIVTLLGN